MTVALAEQFGRVCAIDISPDMLTLAEANIASAKDARPDSVQETELHLVPGDGQIPFESATFDAVISYITLQHIPDI